MWHGCVPIPYIKGGTEDISSNSRKNKVTVHAKPYNTICSRLVASKDKTDKLDNSGNIYQTGCHDCHQLYAEGWIGGKKMERKLKLTKHGRASLPVREHLQNNRHVLPQDCVHLSERDERSHLYPGRKICPR